MNILLRVDEHFEVSYVREINPNDDNITNKHLTFKIKKNYICTYMFFYFVLRSFAPYTRETKS